jgi:hypothetical protein
VFRADAAFTKPESKAIRIPANDNPVREIEELVTRLAGRPSDKLIVRYKHVLYQSAG